MTRQATVRTGGTRRTERSHICVRCGDRQAAPELYICAACLEDPDQARERAIVEEYVYGHAEQRRTLVDTFGWRGGWWS